MSKRLEDRLTEIEKIAPLNNDREIASALRFIIEEESKEIREDNVELISEAAELLLNIEGIKEDEIEVNSKRILSEFTRGKVSRTSVKNHGKGKFLQSITSFRKVAVFALLIVSAAVILASFNGGVRAAVKNTFVTWMRELAIINFSEKKSDETEPETAFDELCDIDSIKLKSVPDGFKLESSKNDGISKLYTYKKGNDFVMVEMIPTDRSGIIHSTENHKYSEIMINGSLGYLFYNSEKRTGSVVLGDSKITVIIGGVAEREVLIEFAEGIEQK